MWRNYWTVAVRALAKSRTYSIINIAGLAIGMAACIMILLYIRYEQSYDKWLPDVENTYQVQSWYPHPKDQPPGFFQMGTYVAQTSLQKALQAPTGSHRDTASVRWRVGMVLLAMGEHDAARMNFQIGADVDPRGKYGARCRERL